MSVAPSSPLTGLRWGFIGGGRMAQALIVGLLESRAAQPESVRASDVSNLALETLARDYGIATSTSNREVAQQSDCLVLAIKPQVLGAVLSELAPSLNADHLVISIVAGATLSGLEQGLGPRPRLVRVMPNTPALVGQAATAYCLGPRTNLRDEQIVRAMFEAVGRAVSVPEHLMDAVTGLSGSGPAYVYVMIEALIDGGVRVGLPRSIATALAAQTVLGAARMVLGDSEGETVPGHPSQLKDAVTSPGGTTIAGLHALERAGFRAALMDAVEAATRRSSELAQIADSQ